jgi:hypothetical protein
MVAALLTAFAMLLLSATPVAWSSQTAAQGPASNSNSAATETQFSRYMTAGADAYVNGRFLDAAHSFGLAAAMAPASGQAQFWAGQALVYGRQPAQAVPYLVAAERAGVESVALHLALVSAFAGTGREADLDRERALLHAWHRDPEHESLEREQGFIVETFYTRRWHVNVMEFFEPEKNDGNVWRFNVRDAAEAIEMTYLLRARPESDHDRGYELVRVVKHPGELDEQRRVRTYGSLPEYSGVKGEVEGKLRFQFPTAD